MLRGISPKLRRWPLLAFLNDMLLTKYKDPTHRFHRLLFVCPHRPTVTCMWFRLLWRQLLRRTAVPKWNKYWASSVPCMLCMASPRSLVTSWRLVTLRQFYIVVDGEKYVSCGDSWRKNEMWGIENFRPSTPFEGFIQWSDLSTWHNVK